MPVDYVRADQTRLLPSVGATRAIAHLLWGDRVERLSDSGTYTRVRARGREGYVKRADLGGASLLEIYFIDVGQGDGVLIRTPDHRHILIDGGYPRTQQPTGKNAADFVDWKFAKDYGVPTIALDAVIASHNDLDHYGGLTDLLDRDAPSVAELDATGITVEDFYHAGLSWWRKPGSSGRWLGPHEDTAAGRMWTQLLGGRDSVLAAVEPAGNPRLSGEWARLFENVLATRRASGAPTRITRLSHATPHLPGFEPAPGRVAVRVLGPVEYGVDGKPALRRFGGGDSQNTNGQSVLLRLDYGRARIVLTGDLNSASQQALLDEYAGQMQELECDVAKSCHHGSDDVSYRFLQALRAAVTVISSGDAEGHDHPRPAIIAASATSGYSQIEGDEIRTPLIYSTELARSLRLGKPTALHLGGDASSSPQPVTGAALRVAQVDYSETTSGALNPRKGRRSLGRSLLVTGLIYGLVNVRTDGDRILCATRNEADLSWQIKTLPSRF